MYRNNHHNSSITKSPTGPKKVINTYEYDMDECIGVGQFSAVFKGRNTLNGQCVAIKVIDNSKIKHTTGQQLLKHELQILKMLDSPYTLRLYQYIYTANNQYLITDYCNEGDLSKFQIKSEKSIIHIFRGILLGLKELQNKGIVHRDIKPANILMHDGNPMLADFGFATHLSTQKLQNFNVGTPLYMAPEALFQNECGFESDVWSVGITLYQVLFGRTPFETKSEEELRKLLNHYTQSPQLVIPNGTFVDVLLGMLHPNPAMRWTVDQILYSPLFNIPEPIEIKTTQTSPTETLPLSRMKRRSNIFSYTNLDSALIRKQLFTKTQSHIQESNLYDFIMKLVGQVKQYERHENDFCLRWCLYKILLEDKELNNNQYQQLMSQYRQLIQQNDVTTLTDPEIPELLRSNYNNDILFYQKVRQVLNRHILVNQNAEYLQKLYGLDDYLHHHILNSNVSPIGVKQSKKYCN